MSPRQKQKAANAAFLSGEQMCQWVGSLERQLKDVGNVFEEQLHGVDGGVLGQLDDSMLKKLGHELGRCVRMLKAVKALKCSKPVVAPVTPTKKTQTQETKPAEVAAQPPKQKPKGSPSEKLLVVEVFAGSHPVGRHFQQLQAQQKTPAPYSLAAYAAIEAQQPDGEKFRAPEPHALGLTPAHHMSLHALVQDTAARTKLLNFVHRELQDSGVDGVVVLGGPPCTKYSNADKQFRLRRATLEQIKLAYADAERQLKQLQTKAGGEVPESAGKLRRAQRLVVSLKEAYQVAADAVHKDELEVQAADETVCSFLSLFKEIQKACKAAGNTPCHLVMENPYSAADRALWNRPFMKEEHLLNLPDAPKAAEVAKKEKFKPSSSAWLNTVWQNWCTYAPQQPQKDTIIFTTLSTKDLPARKCSKHCKCPERKKSGSHEVQVAKKGGAYERAPWPTEFVGAVLRACVGSKAYEGL